MDKPMKSFCALCGKEILSDTDAVEIGLGYWKSTLEPYKHVRIVCQKDFSKHLLDLLNLRNEWEVLNKKS